MASGIDKHEVSEMDEQREVLGMDEYKVYQVSINTLGSGGSRWPL